MTVLEVNNVSKSYRNYGSELKRLINIFVPLIPVKNEFWALRNINLKIERGQSVGLVGINGAGKSTLLKIITGTLQPTLGNVKRFGKISAILELGMGFNPNLTGRQNAINSAGLLGYSSKEINDVLPFIKEFSEIGEFFERPVRIYSSGMQMRVAFAVATAFRPDLLIIDEALSVGDLNFQQKCIERINSFKKEGTALLFVTHDLAALHEICDESILVVNGEIKKQGPTIEIVEEYFRYINLHKTMKLEFPKHSLKDAFYPLSHFVKDIKILSEEREEISYLFEGKTYIIKLSLENLHLSPDPHVGIRIRNRLGAVMYESNTHCHRQSLISRLGENGSLLLEISFLNSLCVGEYSLSVGIDSEGGINGSFKGMLAVTEKVLSFTVIRGSNSVLWAGSSNIFPVYNYQKN